MKENIKLYKYMTYEDAHLMIKNTSNDALFSGFAPISSDNTNIKDTEKSLPENNKICLVISAPNINSDKIDEKYLSENYKIDNILKYTENTEKPVIGKAEPSGNLISFDNLYQASLYECLQELQDNPPKAYISLDHLISFAEDDMKTSTFTKGMKLANTFNSIYNVYRNRNTGELVFMEKDDLKNREESIENYKKQFVSMTKDLSKYLPEEFKFDKSVIRRTEKNNDIEER